jgi:ferredoxin-NADP reductase
MVATRMRDTAFKRVLRTLPLGSQVKVEGPFGSMTLHRKVERAGVILAGGIGITPFRSMIGQALQQNTGQRLFLFYANRRPKDAAFLAELERWAAQHPNFTLVATMTGKSGVPWNGETGRIDKPLLEKYVGDLAKPVYYLAGPLGLVAAMRDVLSAAGVPEDEVNSEEFFGY